MTISPALLTYLALAVQWLGIAIVTVSLVLHTRRVFTLVCIGPEPSQRHLTLLIAGSVLASTGALTSVLVR